MSATCNRDGYLQNTLRTRYSESWKETWVADRSAVDQSTRPEALHHLVTASISNLATVPKSAHVTESAARNRAPFYSTPVLIPETLNSQSNSSSCSLSIASSTSASGQLTLARISPHLYLHLRTYRSRSTTPPHHLPHHRVYRISSHISHPLCPPCPTAASRRRR